MKRNKMPKCLCVFLVIAFAGCAVVQNFRMAEAPTNYALASNGSIVTASGSTPGRDLFTVINGVISSENWDEGEGWECAFTRRRPEGAGWSRLDPRSSMEFGSAWLEVQFESEKLINMVTIYTIDSAKYPASRYGIKEAWLQIWKEYGWTTVGEVQDGYITSRTTLDRKLAGGKMVFRFDPIKTDKIRFVVFRSNDIDVTGEGWTSDRKTENSVARVIEIEASGLEKPKEKTKSDDSWTKSAPDFNLQDVNGSWIRLSNLKGNIVVVTFWATWSPESQQQIQGLNSLNNQYKDQGVVVLGISVDEGGAERIKPFIQNNNLNYTILIADTSVKSDYGGIGKLPSTFIIDTKGNIKKEYLGYRDAHLLELDVKNILMREPTINE